MDQIYFREDTQELKELPVREINCYYLGRFNKEKINRINRYLAKEHISFIYLKTMIDNGRFE